MCHRAIRAYLALSALNFAVGEAQDEVQQAI
jgi:hypothetical protein